MSETSVNATPGTAASNVASAVASASPSAAPSTVIRTESLVFAYPRGGVRALKGVSISIQKGDVVSILGSNGSGKTTLVRHFNGLLRPTSGKVFLMGEDTARKSTAQMSRVCGYVFQNPNHQIFRTTVRDELLVGPANYGLSERETKEGLERVCGLMDLSDLLDKHPMALDYTSKKIVTIASVLISNPEVFVLDEPTSGLDEVGRQMLSKIIGLVHNEGRTVVMITHDMDYAAENSSRIILMDQGEIVRDCTPDQAFLDVEAMRRAQVEPPQIASLDLALQGEGATQAALSVEGFVRKYGRQESC